MTSDTFQTIQDDAAGRFEQAALGHGSDFPLLPRWINQAYHFINAYQDWKWTEKTTTFSIASGANSIALTTIDPYYRRVRGANLSYENGLKIPIVTTNDYDKVKPNPTISNDSGEPQIAYIWSGKLFVDPIADQSYNFLLRYFAYDADMVNPTDKPNLPIQAPELLAIWGYKMILQTNFMYDQATVQENLFNSKLQILCDSELSKNDSEEVMVDIDELPYNISL